MNAPQPFAGVWRTLRALLVVAGALAAALLCFLVLPLLQAISSSPEPDLTLVPMQTAELPPPPPVEDEPPPEPEKPKEQPKLDESAEPLDLAQLEMALNASFGDGGLGGEFAVPIPGLGGGGDEAIESLFSLNDLDQKPRALHQPQPVLTAALRKKLPAKVTVLFVVDQQGRVQNPIVQSSSDPSFEAAVLQAIQQWKFEPGKRDGQPVRSRMRQPFQFEG